MLLQVSLIDRYWYIVDCCERWKSREEPLRGWVSLYSILDCLLFRPLLRSVELFIMRFNQITRQERASYVISTCSWAAIVVLVNDRYIQIYSMPFLARERETEGERERERERGRKREKGGWWGRRERNEMGRKRAHSIYGMLGISIRWNERTSRYAFKRFIDNYLLTLPLHTYARTHTRARARAHTYEPIPLLPMVVEIFRF